MSGDRVPALTLHQPWAWAIVAGHKTIENREWSTKYRGRLLIHAGKTYDMDAADWIEQEAEIDVPAELPQGTIVGEVRLVHVDDDPQETNLWAVPGMYHWLLSNAVAYEKPVPARGMPGLWYPQ